MAGDVVVDHYPGRVQIARTPGDVGGWFRTAVDGAVALPATPAWGPGTGGFGLVSPDKDVDAAARLLWGRRTLVLTGAGMSTDSGLPDYRGRDSVPRSPMTYQEFVGSDLSRRRYWARSTVGWRWFADARPNSAHFALAELGRVTPLVGVVTQNVDGLHQAAGSSPVVDLHGNLARVTCLNCGAVTNRADLQRQLLSLNPALLEPDAYSESSNRVPVASTRSGRFAPGTGSTGVDAAADSTGVAPDGDADVDRTHDFRYPDCVNCGGMLKPDVVYFGENAPREVTERAHAMLDASEALLVLGTSLSVMSGLRFLRRSVKDGRPIVIVNDGATRGDDLATLRLHGRIAPILGRWLRAG